MIPFLSALLNLKNNLSEHKFNKFTSLSVEDGFISSVMVTCLLTILPLRSKTFSISLLSLH